MTIDRRCGSCRFYRPKEKECRVHAPTPVVIPHPVSGAPVVMGFWPATRETNWCGDWQAKVEA